ncbi:MAG: hypothetical protein ACHQRM_16705 [Bacteroidia bacterium]
MNKMNAFLLIGILILITVYSCKKDNVLTPPPSPRLIFRFKFDSTQARLDNLGNPSALPANHKAQCPRFNLMSAHYIEMANDGNLLGQGSVLYNAPTTTAGGNSAIDFGQSVVVTQGQDFYSAPITGISPGTYKWLRVSLAYQNYDIAYKSASIPGNGLGTGTVASFIGFNTYLTSYKIKTMTVTPSASTGGPGNHKQGYWGFETTVFSTTYFSDGQAPAGATTVVNPMPGSPIPAGSCVVTGQFVNSGGLAQPLVITGHENSDIIITVSLSTNNSFEWVSHSGGNYYQPDAGDTVVDMGIRGLIPAYNH